MRGGSWVDPIEVSRTGRSRTPTHSRTSAGSEVIFKDSRIGWSPTILPAGTCDAYAEVIAELGRALRLHRTAEITDGGRTKKPTPPPCVCECGRRIRVSPTVLAVGPITCGVCGGDFEPDQANDQSAESAA